MGKYRGCPYISRHKIYDTILAVLKTPGVVRFIGSIPGEPKPVPEEQIISLKSSLKVKNLLTLIHI